MMFRRKMPLSSKIFAVLAVVLGSAAFLVVQSERARYQALIPVAGSPVAVVVTRTEIARGSVLAAAGLETRQVPQAFVPPGAVASLEDVVGKVLASDVASGEVLTRTRLVVARVGPLAGLVPDGMRAMAIAVPVPQGLRAGDRVDVLATYGAEGRVYTETVGFALEVMRVMTPTGGLGGGAGGTGSPTLVVLTSPDEAERLATAVAFATVQIAVVGPES